MLPGDSDRPESLTAHKLDYAMLSHVMYPTTIVVLMYYVIYVPFH